MAEILEQIPPETRPSFEKYMNEPLKSRELLRDTVDERLEKVREAATKIHFMDVTTADFVGDGLKHLVTDAPDDLLSHVQAAVLYFISDDDLTSDYEPVVGFDDDAKVFNAVCKLMDRSELLVPV